MGELITAQNLIPSTPVSVPPGTPLPTQSQGININMSDVKEIITLLNDGLKNFKALQEMRASMTPQQNNLAPQGANVYTADNRTVIPTATLPTTKNNKMIVDRAKLRILLVDLVLNQAKKLPKEILEKKLGELTGEQFKTFKYRYNNIADLDADWIINAITEQFSNQIDTMIKEGE